MSAVFSEKQIEAFNTARHTAFTQSTDLKHMKVGDIYTIRGDENQFWLVIGFDYDGDLCTQRFTWDDPHIPRTIEFHKPSMLEDSISYVHYVGIA